MRRTVSSVSIHWLQMGTASSAPGHGETADQCDPQCLLQLLRAALFIPGSAQVRHYRRHRGQQA